MSVDLTKVRDNFSKRTDSYSSAAKCQSDMAQDLIASTLPFLRANPQQIVDMGVGTGFLSAELHQRYPLAQIVGVDLSPAMIATAEKNPLISNRQFKGVVANVLDYSLPQNTDLCISGFTFQWIENLDALLGRIREQLSQQGVLAFSTLCQGTFPTLHNVFSSLGFPYPGPHLRSYQDVASMVSTYFNIHVAKEVSYSVVFENANQFLRHIQQTGAINPHKTLSVSTMRKVLARYAQTATAPIEENYQVAIFVATPK